MYSYGQMNDFLFKKEERERERQYISVPIGSFLLILTDEMWTRSIHAHRNRMSPFLSFTLVFSRHVNKNKAFYSLGT